MIEDPETVFNSIKLEIEKKLPDLSDFKFNDRFKTEFLRLHPNWNIKFFDYSAMVTTSSGGHIFLNGHWFYVAALLVPLYRYLKEIGDSVKEAYSKYYDLDHYEEWSKGLKDHGSAIQEKIEQELVQVFSPEEYLNIKKFLTNYKSWGGGKAIGRGQNDYYHSSLMKAGGLLAESSGFISALTVTLENKTDLYYEILSWNDGLSTSENNININLDYPRNRIIYGAPGTGKSYKLEDESNGYEIVRVTFNPEYTYGQFIGVYKPISKAGNIVYDLNPGPFIRCLEKAKNVSDPVVLLVEEINRANVSSVFGDVFQLLDRDSNGKSSYGITMSTDIMGYLLNNGIISSLDEQIYLPSNLYIWATMNSADQGVFPMDSAFKRRWSFEYLNIDEGEAALDGKQLLLNGSVSVDWNKLRKSINKILTDKNIPEDKLIGPFFLTESELRSALSFRGKLLIYLWDDILRHKDKSIIFGKSSLLEIHKILLSESKLDALCREIFSENLSNLVLQSQDDTDSNTGI